MRSVTQSKQRREPVYPCLMETSDSGLIVLFTTGGTGTVVHTGTDTFKIGHSSLNWAQSSFTKYTGEVVLSND